MLAVLTWVCVVAVVINGAAGREISSEDFYRVDTLAATANHTTTWICHVKSDYGVGGVVNKSRCSSSCNETTDSKEYLGYIGAVVAILMFGSNFIPVKKYDTGDGVFFQWVLCIGIWLVGLVVNFILDSPIFFLPAVMGGAMWTTGNMLVVPIIKMIGMTMGLTVWGVGNMLSGWIVGRFILGQPVECDGLNYGGVGIVVLSVIMMAFVKSEGNKSTPKTESKATESSPLLGSNKSSSTNATLSERVRGCCANLFQTSKVHGSPVASINSDKLTFSSKSPLGGGTIVNSAPSDNSWVEKLGVWQKRIIGFALCLVCGPLFSFIFLPVEYMKLCDDGLHSCTDMNYIFGVYSGILFTSTFYFFAYSAITLNKPKVYPSVILPGLISGIMWGIAMMGWFLANQHLSLAISFPLVTAGPGFISSAWGILVFREIKGWKYILLFFVAFCVSLSGLILNGLSRCRVQCN